MGASKLLQLLWCLWSAVLVTNCQTIPYVHFMGVDLANHSYVDLDAVGPTMNESIECRTDLMACCTSAVGEERGAWFYPNETRLPFIESSVSLYFNRGNQSVFMYRTNPVAVSDSGIYQCRIETNAVHFEGADGGVGDIVYVGAYKDGGEYLTQYIIVNWLCIPTSLVLQSASLVSAVS